MNLNKAMLIGNVTRQPEVRTTPGGQSVCSFGLATNRRYTDKEGVKQDQAEFHNIVAWGKLAEICGQYLVKGQEVYIEGRIQTRNWDAPDGAKRNRTEIVCENMQMGAKPKGFAPRSEADQPLAGTTTPSAPSTEEINVEE